MVVVVIKWRGESGLRDFAVFVLVAVVARFPYLGLPWPVPLVLPILVYGGMRRWRGASRVVASVDCARDAATLSTTLRYALIGSACAAAGLLGWYQLAAPDLTTFARLIPAWPVPAIILAGVAFYCLNAITEELAFRNIVYGQLTVAGLSIAYVIAAQALAFGFLHWHGVPGGVPGIVLSATYGLVQGVIRHKSRGLLASWLSHVVADLIIFAFVLRSVA
ncbi:CPBP family intramembrane glutamic endopeptidase [Ralstonia chuxiongensis]|uniref:CPBP family intramembrane glutamic endopeptidase n=1 Tax=Ralstonia chuxiongensis TaxID=2957504 RepID=UPI0028F61BC0|nr:CPBP family intramembrane glutamic endopeptidase [Ralstonia chuxiongensis]CAJ0783769.1 hypothetical protein R8510_05173 [Ralstonia chuxiongensis]